MTKLKDGDAKNGKEKYILRPQICLVPHAPNSRELVLVDVGDLI